MATISVTTAPASGVEWKTFNATVTVTRGPFDAWINGTINIYLKYGGVTVYSNSYFHNSNTSIMYIFGTVNGNPLLASYPYSGATIEASFVPNAGGTVNTIPPQRTINITAATALFSGGPFSRAVKEGCRWTEELVTVTMQDSGSTITGFGDGYTYNLSSSDGITFKDAVGGAAITSITFAGGVASFAICMNDEKASAVFTITNASDAANTYTSDPINVVNPSFTFENFFDSGNKAVTGTTITNGKITSDNPLDTGHVPVNFPSAGWSVSSDPGAAAVITAVAFASGVLSNISCVYGGVQSSVKIKLVYSGSPACSAESASFDIVAAPITNPFVLSRSASVS